MEIKVEGLDDLRILLQQKLPDDIQKRALLATLNKAAKPIIQEARARAPVLTGRMKKAIYSFRSRKSTKEKAVVMIGVKSGHKYGAKDAYYWRWVEFGRGVVKVGKKRGARRGGERARSLGNPTVGWFGKEVKAAPAKPFMRPAFEAKKTEAIEVFRATMKGEIEKTAAKYQAGLERRILRKFL